MLVVTAFAVAAMSAVVPVINVEVYLGVVATQLEAGTDPALLLLLAAAAGVAQALGKLCWYLVAVHSMDSRRVQRALGRGTRRHRFELWQRRIVGRPWLSAGVLALSSIAGLPPLLLMSLVAGAVRVPIGLFLPTVAVGRTLRFWALISGVSLLARA